MDKELLEALKVILDKSEYFDDEGPYGEGWKSEQLRNALAVVQRAVKNSNGSPSG